MHVQSVRSSSKRLAEQLQRLWSTPTGPGYVCHRTDYANGSRYLPTTVEMPHRTDAAWRFGRANVS